MKISSRSTRNKSASTYWILGAIVLIILALLAYLAYGYHSRSIWPFQQTIQTDTSSKNRDVNQVDYGPPSQEDISQSQTGKQNVTNQDSSTKNNTAPSPSTAKKAVEVGVSFADVVGTNVEIRAFTPTIIEGGGTCMAQLQKDGKTVTATSEAFIDSSSSQCNPIYIDLSKFSEKGEWSLTVKYSSSNAEGTSEKIGVDL